MSDLADWIETIAKLAIPAVWVLMKVLNGAKKARSESQSGPASAPEPQRLPAPVRSAPQRPTSSSGRGRAAGMLARLHTLHTQLVAQRDQVSSLANARGERGAVVRQVLATTVAQEVGELEDAIEQARAGGLIDGTASVDMLRYRFQRLATQLQVLETAARLGETPSIDAVMADAEAIADACIAPFQQFTTTYEIPFPPTRPICLPASLAGGEAAWIGLLGLGVPVVFVPDDFEDDLMRWPSIAHELGHVILNGVPGLLDEMGRALGWTARPDLLQVVNGRIVGSPVQAWSAWREELLADALTVLMLGPAALDGFCAVFARPDDPDAVLEAHAHRGRYAPHPPAHLRVHLAAFLLEEVGFIQEGRNAARAWNELHGFPEVLDAEDAAGPNLILPLADGRVVGMDLAVALDRGTHGIRSWLYTQYTRLGGHSVLALPGFDLAPGVWAKVLQTSRQLQAGAVPKGDGRVLLAAAIHAAVQPRANGRTIARAVQQAIIGRGEGRSRSRTSATHAHTSDRRTEVLDALLLQELLARPPGKARMAGRPPSVRR